MSFFVNKPLHFFSFHDMKINKKSVLSEKWLRASRVCSPINLKSEMKFLHTIFNNLGYPKHLVDPVFFATKNKFCNRPSPLDTEEPSATSGSWCLTIVRANSSYSTNVLWSLLLIQNVYLSTIARSLASKSQVLLEAEGGVNKSQVLLEAEGGVHSISCLVCSDKYFGENIKSLNSRISQLKYNITRFKWCNAMYRHMLKKKPLYWLEKCIICLQ